MNKIRERLQDETGAANLVAFIFFVPIFFMVFLGAWHFSTAKEARKDFDRTMVFVAKAAASQTETTADGVLVINVDDALTEAALVYELQKPFIDDSMNYKVMDPSSVPVVSVDCTQNDPENNCLGITVEVVDTFRGNVFTSGIPWLNSLDFRGTSEASLVFSE